MKSTKSFKPKEWKAMKLVSDPTETSGQVRRDESGRHWEWAGQIQNITAKPFNPKRKNGNGRT